MTLAMRKHELINARRAHTAWQLLVNFIRVWADCPVMSFAPVWPWLCIREIIWEEVRRDTCNALANFSATLIKHKV